MQGLHANDVRALVDFVGDAYAIATSRRFRVAMLERLRTLIPSDMTAWVDTSAGGRDATAIASPRDLLPDGPRRFARIRDEHPVLAHFERSRHGGAVDLSDLCSRGQLRRLRFYQEFLRPAGVEHQLSIALPTPGPRLTRITFNRGEGRFRERDRVLLDLLRPHLARAWENAETFDRLGVERRSLEQVADAFDVGVIVVRGGRPTYVNARARAHLGAYFAARTWRRLPEPLGEWLATQRRFASPMRDPLRVERDGGRLEVRALSDGTGHILVLRERRLRVAARDLESLGLSRRQADVLAWLAEGKSNPEIATILAISPHTVARHVEAVFERLGVRTRTAAAAAAFGHVHPDRFFD